MAIGNIGRGFRNVLAAVFQAGNRVIINSKGLFVYNGTPASGNLILAITNANGTDQFGNKYFRVLSIINQTTNGISFLTNDVNEVQNSYMGVSVQNPGASEHLFSIWAGAAIATGHGAISDQVQTTLFSSALDGSSKAAGIHYYVTPASVNIQAMKWNDQGINAIGTITAQALGNTQPTPETWHALTVLAGFSNGSPAPQYKLMPDNTVKLRGAVNLTANQVAGTAWWSVPLGYRSSTASQGPFNTIASVAGVLAPAGVTITSTQGTLNRAQNNGDFFLLDGVDYALD